MWRFHILSSYRLGIVSMTFYLLTFHSNHGIPRNGSLKLCVALCLSVFERIVLKELKEDTFSENLETCVQPEAVSNQTTPWDARGLDGENARLCTKARGCFVPVCPNQGRTSSTSFGQTHWVSSPRPLWAFFMFVCVQNFIASPDIRCWWIRGHDLLHPSDAKRPNFGLRLYRLVWGFPASFPWLQRHVRGLRRLNTVVAENTFFFGQANVVPSLCTSAILVTKAQPAMHLSGTAYQGLKEHWSLDPSTPPPPHWPHRPLLCQFQ